MRPTPLLRLGGPTAALLAALSLRALPVHAQQPEPIRLEARRIPMGDSVYTGGLSHLSPDGRWIVAPVRGPSGATNLWAVAARGGAKVRLTSGNYQDRNPQWFPSGNRILFASDRASRTASSPRIAMVLDFDPATGRAVGTPRQLTLDPVDFFNLQLSPDGRQVVYIQEGTNRIKTVPAAGGTARLVVDVAGDASEVTWSADGRHIYYTVWDNRSKEDRLVRVPATGGKPETLFRTDRRILLAVGGQRTLLLDPVEPRSQTRTFAVADARGRVIGRYAVDRQIQLGSASLTSRGLRIMGSQNDASYGIRVVPVSGGPVRDLTTTSEGSYDWPLGWTQDGSAVVASRTTRGQEAIVVAPLAGGAPRVITLPAGEVGVGTVAGDHVSYGIQVPGTEVKRLMTLDLATGTSREIAPRAIHNSPKLLVNPTGGGGGFGMGGGEFLYWERKGDRAELRAFRPGGTSRLVRSFPWSLAHRTVVGVHGERVAYCQPAGDSVALMVGDGPAATPRRVATMPREARDTANTCRRTVAWSHDGRWIATVYHGSQMLVADASPSGAPAAPRLIDTGKTDWWSPRWLPDDSGLTFIGARAAAVATYGSRHIYLVSLRGSASPVDLLQSDHTAGDVEGQQISPDGRHLAYHAMVPRGSSIVLLDVPVDPRAGAAGRSVPAPRAKR